MNPEKWRIFLDLQEGQGVDQGQYDEAKAMFEQYLLIFMPPSQYPRLLDLGCGWGVEVKVLMDMGYEVVGITLGEGNVRYAKEKFGIDVKHMDMHDLEFPPEHFDCAVARQTFEHAQAPWIVALQVWTVLKPKGRWFLDLPEPHNPDMWSTQHTCLLYPNQMRFIFEKTGFSIVNAEEPKNNTLGFNGGRDPYRYVLEKADYPQSDFTRVLKMLREFHARYK